MTCLQSGQPFSQIGSDRFLLLDFSVAGQLRLYWMHRKMSLLRRFVIRAAQELGHNPKARAKASQVLEEDVKPRAKQAWREAQPKIENAKLGLKLFAQRVRDEYRKGRDGK